MAKILENNGTQKLKTQVKTNLKTRNQILSRVTKSSFFNAT